MELKPRIGIDNIKFGMTKSEVIEILGSPDKISNENYGLENETEEIIEWNKPKLRLTFEKSENYRLTYIRVQNQSLTYNGKKIMNQTAEFLKSDIFADISNKWEVENYDFCDVHFDEENWLSINIEFGVANEFEFGTTFKNDNEYDWPN
ncbi:hypothetical protein [Nonlabens sp. MB-3u-79]|uniref:hypothetical protein n=1 Tax=Nonlabens sp. MB-3u-79 TaxID=2058134 RepID=UPI0012FD5814|nr:hypothetical protein [Nonlabens sp. MB-3u-79]